MMTGSLSWVQSYKHLWNFSCQSGYSLGKVCNAWSGGWDPNSMILHDAWKWSLKGSSVSSSYNSCTFSCLLVSWLTLSIAEIHDYTLTGSEFYSYRGRSRHQLTLGKLRSHILPVWHSKEPFSMLGFFSSDVWSQKEIKHPDWTAA